MAVLKSSSQWVLTEEGKGVVSAGSHEALVYNAVPAGGSITLAEIWVNLDLISFTKFKYTFILY